jgi:hypothetical protein
MLTVNQNLKRPRRVTEKSFEDAFGRALEACGRANWHMGMREAGWPDRYVRGGIWIEFKSLEVFGKDNGTDKDQRVKMTELQAGGDKVFYCAVSQKRVICAPWHAIKGRNLAGFETFAYKDKHDLIQIIKWVILGNEEKGHSGEVSAMVAASS